MTYLALTQQNLPAEHICCAIADKKCAAGVALKKQWLAQAFAQGYRFERLDARAKVFVEYGPAEQAWMPVNAPGYLVLGCFWVSGQYKGRGHGKALLRRVIDAACAQGGHGVATVVGARKMHFMSDTKWLLRQGFAPCDVTPAGFALLAFCLNAKAPLPRFKACARTGECPEKNGLVAYYSHRCPFAEWHVRHSLAEAARARGLPLRVEHLATLEQAQSAPTPATVFSLFYNGRMVTTDLSVCLPDRLDKALRAFERQMSGQGHGRTFAGSRNS